MNDGQTASSVEADLKKIAKVGRGRRDLILVAALVVVAILIGAVWVGFRGSQGQVSRSAAAMTVPVPPTAPQAAPRSTTP
jgi:hypothetical protein